MSIYHWKLGDVALARICKKVYAKVYVVKDEKGLFYDDKGISGNEDGSITVTKELCYYVEISRTKHRLWLPYTSLHLAERSRPFYGPKDKPKEKLSTVIKKDPDAVPRKGKYENAFKEFVRRGKEMLFDHYFVILQTIERDEACLDYVLNVDASTEDKFEAIMKNVATEKELENYLHQCWRYNFVNKQSDSRDLAENQNSISPIKPAITTHAPWCLVCGKEDRLRQCPNCPASFHLACRREWLVTIIHRKNPPKKPPKPTTLVEKILSSTRTICSVRKEKENVDLCPSCMWGPRVGYDDVVWHKLGSCPWWPARVLPPGAAPSCLLTRTHAAHQWPLKYYGTLNYSWGDSHRMCLFLPSHTAALAAGRAEALRDAVMDACDDYIAVYLQ